MMRACTATVLAAALFASASAYACAQDPSQHADGAVGASAADTATNPYRDQVTSLSARLASNANDAPTRRALIRALMETGDYARAAATAAAATAAAATDADAGSGAVAFARLRGEALLAQGQRDSAAAAFTQAIRGRAADSITAKIDLALLHLASGARAQAFRELDAFIDYYNNAPTLSAADLTAVGRAVAALGVTDPQLFKDAVKAYEEAAKADPRSVDALVYEASLLLDKYQGAEAQSALADAVRIEPQNPRVLLQVARQKQFDGSDEALRFVDRGLAINPNLVDARVFRARLLFGTENYAGAQKEIDRALAVDSTAIDALAAGGAIAFVRGEKDAYQQTKQRAQRLSPGDASFLADVAALIADQRRYIESVEVAREAVAYDSLSWSARTTEGMGEFRLGRFDDARATLTRAFAGDPYNVWVKNTLDLLDTYPNYVTRSSQRFDLFLNKSEADLMSLYMAPLAEQAYDTFAARYHWKPSEKVRVEVYPRHADLSVRTVGLSGLGALGVSFGDILAMDSPSSRKIGEFHWASTLWHEIAHTFTLGLSDMRVPRWLTEGISGWEEQHDHAGWGDPLAPGFIAAYATGKLPPPSGLNVAFVRPAYPEQVMHAYEMAALIVDDIYANHGSDAIRRMLVEYGTGKSDSVVFHDVLHVTPSAFDAEFAAYMQKQHGPALQGVRSEYADLLQSAAAAVEAGDDAVAVQRLDRARAILPEYAGPGSPYAMLAAIDRRHNNAAGEAQWLNALTSRYAQDYEAWLRLAELRAAAHDTAGAASALMQAIYVHPYDPKVHDQLAVFYATLKQPQLAVRERRAIVALNPPDKAAVYYQLALALQNAGQKDEARTQVLKALEVAPGYAAAQDLLLKLQEGK